MLTVFETPEELGKSSSPIIYFSRYRADQVDNGGARRSAQLRQLLEGYDVAVVSSLVNKQHENARSPVKRSKILLDQAVRAFVRCRMRKYSEEFGRWLFFSDRRANRWVQALQCRIKPSLVILDDPIFFPSLIRFCTKQGIPVIAHCHNIETLSRGQVSSNYQLELLRYELGLLTQCRGVVTISSEEAFLLRNLGITTGFLPYHPPEPIKQQLLHIRKLRIDTPKRDFLLLGSAGNVPTRKGMMQLLAAWERMGWASGERLIVAGYGTEVLREAASIPGVDFCGDINDDTLAGLLIRIRSGIVYQEEGAGALTRIGEYLLAGVPVVVNNHAARSWHNFLGVIEFKRFDELRNILTGLISIVPEVAIPSSPDSSELHRLLDPFLIG
ncbi:MAG: glycosyltransferase [Geobacteraceae bacterium]|nr:glycosyltransferase [Geobacteraceae bacterium]